MKIEENTFICGDCMEVLKDLPDGFADLCLTDPPYGIGKQVGSNGLRGKNNYLSTDDTPEYVRDVVIPRIEECHRVAKRMIITPGNKNAFSYRQPNALGVFYQPAATGFNTWGFQDCQPILYYGRSPNGNVQKISALLNESASTDLHPCAKPLNAWSWLLSVGARPGDLVIDPFCGSGTTAIACHNFGCRFICIDKEPEYIAIAERRYQELIAQGNLFGEEACQDKGSRETAYNKPQPKMAEQMNLLESATSGEPGKP